jgi:hypothetical protein
MKISMSNIFAASSILIWATAWIVTVRHAVAGLAAAAVKESAPQNQTPAPVGKELVRL